MNEGDSQDHLILFALWLLVFSASSQIMIVSPMLPQIGRELNVPEAVQGTLVSAYALMVGLFALIIGPVSDKVGRRRVLLLGSGAMCATLALHSAAYDYTSLLLARTLSGAAGGMLSGAAVSYVGDYFPYERRGWAGGWIMSSTALGQILGVPAGTFLAAGYGFRLPFLLFAGTMAAAFFLVWKFVPQPDVKRAAGRLTVRSALGKYRKLLGRGEVRAAALAFCLMFLGLALYVIYQPTWLNARTGAGGSEIALLFLVGGIANALTGPLAGKLSDRVGRKSVIIASCLGLSVMMLATSVLVRGGNTLWIAYPLFFVTMILVAARMSPFQALLSTLATGDERGSLLSLTVALGQVGFALGGVIAGPAYSRLGYVSNTIGGAACMLVMAFLVWRFLPEPGRDSSADAEDAAASPQVRGAVKAAS